MIIGIGIDITDIKRIKKILNQYGKKFQSRCFSNKEIINSNKALNKASYYAKKYAAKEACAKALGTGFSQGIFLKDIVIENDIQGKPKIKLFNEAKKRLDSLSTKPYEIQVSLSDEKQYAIANVIISEIYEI
jgi:holo-[acyl-carrier protein] synthase